MRVSRSHLGALVAAAFLTGAIAGCGSSATTTSSGTGSAAPVSAAGAYGGGGATSSSASTSASTQPAVPAALITTKHSKAGTILAYGPKRLTVYLFEADRGSTSACGGRCAEVWPPVTGTPHAGGTALGRGLGTVRRSDGSIQVTYHGHPLYLFVKDRDDGDAYGQGLKSFGAAWYALRPSGEKADTT